MNQVRLPSPALTVELPHWGQRTLRGSFTGSSSGALIGWFELPLAPGDPAVSLETSFVVLAGEERLLATVRGLHVGQDMTRVRFITSEEACTG